MAMLKRIKQATLTAGKQFGLFELAARTSWRSNRLLILCYHGVSLEFEHHWRRPLFMTRAELQERFEILKSGGYTVLPLDRAIDLLYAGDLPERSVAITFDDGNYDFYAQAYPLLRQYGFPATVYLTTYYADHEVPVFSLICSYIFWKRRGEVVPADDVLGRGTLLDLRTADGRGRAVTTVSEFAERGRLTVGEKDQLARDLATLVGEDADALWGKRVLQLMNAREVAELSAAGVDFQLHTHRHRSPRDENLYRREIRENRACIQAMSGMNPSHFCYPSGVYRPEFLPWLAAEQVNTATTTRPALAHASSHRLLLPRLVDHASLSATEFEGWLTGVAGLLPQRSRRRGV